MKIIVPMAGRGSRMRPHTLTVPKPLIPVAGIPMVQHLVEDIINGCNEKVDEIAYIIGDFGIKVEEQLISIAEGQGAKGSIYYQDKPLGTAHAILCAKQSLTGKVVVAFADTLFRANFKIDPQCDGIVWVNKVDDPRQFGVVKLAADNSISDFVEKPEEFVSDLAIIGIYYFKDGKQLSDELQYLIDNKILDKGEYQLTNALENMKSKGKRLLPGEVMEWLDCGNKNATVYTNKRMLEIKHANNTIGSSLKQTNSVIIPPCYIGDSVEISNSIIGPHVSIGNESKVTGSVISNSVIQSNSQIKNACIENTMVGNFASYEGGTRDLSIGDYCTIS